MIKYQIMLSDKFNQVKPIRLRPEINIEDVKYWQIGSTPLRKMSNQNHASAFELLQFWHNVKRYEN